MDLVENIGSLSLFDFLKNKFESRKLCDSGDCDYMTKAKNCDKFLKYLKNGGNKFHIWLDASKVCVVEKDGSFFNKVYFFFKYVFKDDFLRIFNYLQQI